MTAVMLMLSAAPALAQHKEVGGEASLKLPDLASVSFLGMNGHSLLLLGLLFCVLGLLFGLVIYMQLKNLPVHKSMREISELIYETCKTYLITQGKFILHPVGLHRASIIVVYFGVALSPCRTAIEVHCRSSWSSAWSASPAATAWPGSASASTPSPTPARPSPACAGKPYPDLRHPAARPA